VPKFNAPVSVLA